MNVSWHSEQLQTVLARLGQVNDKVRSAIDVAMTAALMYIWESVPGYPPQSPTSVRKHTMERPGGGRMGYYTVEEQGYHRTGSLGRSFGVGMEGGRSGEPDVMKTTKADRSGYAVAEFGSRLDYSRYVVGDYQTRVHQAHGWWTVDKTLWPMAQMKIIALFDKLSQKIAAFIETGSF